jgi:hypothetical protein
MACDTHLSPKKQKATLQNGVTNRRAGINKKKLKIMNDQLDIYGLSK